MVLGGNAGPQRSKCSQGSRVMVGLQREPPVQSAALTPAHAGPRHPPSSTPAAAPVPSARGDSARSTVREGPISLEVVLQVQRREQAEPAEPPEGAGRCRTAGFRGFPPLCSFIPHPPLCALPYTGERADRGWDVGESAGVGPELNCGSRLPPVSVLSQDQVQDVFVCGSVKKLLHWEQESTENISQRRQDLQLIANTHPSASSSSTTAQSRSGALGWAEPVG